MSNHLEKRVGFMNYVDLINTKRAWVSSVVLSIFIVILCFIIYIFDLFGPYTQMVLLVGIFAGLFQLISSVLLFLIVKNQEVEKYKIIYIVYYVVTIVTIMCVAAFDMKENGSEVLYAVACIYFIFIPILSDRWSVIFIAIQTMFMILLILFVDMGTRCLLDTIIMQSGTAILSNYQHNLTIRIKKISDNLKMKTKYSEQDALTGLANRRGLDKKAESIWPYCQRKKIPVGIIALDIDFFKKYNDKFGHPQGDRCIKMIANTLKATAKRNTDIVTRTGGEEFLIFIQDISPKEILSLALTIRKNINEQAIAHAYCEISKYVTVSIGVATTIPKLNYNFNSLYEEADRSLYLAKRNGRNCIVFDGNLYGRMKNGISQVIDMR